MKTSHITYESIKHAYRKLADDSLNDYWLWLRLQGILPFIITTITTIMIVVIDYIHNWKCWKRQAKSARRKVSKSSWRNKFYRSFLAIPGSHPTEPLKYSSNSSTELREYFSVDISLRNPASISFSICKANDLVLLSSTQSGRKAGFWNELNSHFVV